MRRNNYSEPSDRPPSGVAGPDRGVVMPKAMGREHEKKAGREGGIAAGLGVLRLVERWGGPQYFR